MLTVSFVSADGSKTWKCEANEGDSLLEIAHNNDIDIEGACEGNMACSTCHVIVDKEHFDKLTPAIEDEEEMLDLAYDLHATSRLGCQITMTKELDGLVVTLPKGTSNMMGF